MKLLIVAEAVGEVRALPGSEVAMAAESGGTARGATPARRKLPIS